MKRYPVWKAVCLLLVALALFAGRWLPAAEAHAMLVSAYPAPGAILDATPVEIRLTFSERIGLGSTIQLFGPQFRAVPGVQSGLDPAAPELLRAFPPQLSPDTYTVEWSVISLDGHPVSGSYAFAVRAAAAGAAVSSAPAPPTGVPWPWVTVSLVGVAVGGVMWEIMRWRRLSRPPAPADRPKGKLS